MVVHKYEMDRRGVGRWEAKTGRYVPVGGGSRSRLSIADSDEPSRRYPGFVGMDEKLTDSIRTMADLYAHLGGGTEGRTGREGEWARKIQGVMEEQRKAEEEELAAQAGRPPAAEPTE